MSGNNDVHECHNNQQGVICDDAWILVKSFMFCDKFDVTRIIEYHTGLPYTLGLNTKGVECTFQYLWDNHPDIFDVLPVVEVRRIIKNYNSKMLVLYA